MTPTSIHTGRSLFLSNLFKEVRKLIYIIVGIAGILGALSRYYLGLNITTFWHHSFPLATLLISNRLLLLSVANYLYRPAKHLTFRGHHRHRNWIHRFLYDFSTFSVETVQLINHSEWSIAFLYVSCSILGGLIMSGLGYTLGDFLIKKSLTEGDYS